MKRSLITVGVMALTAIVLVSVFASGVSVTTSGGKIGISIGQVQADELSIGEIIAQRTENSKTFYLGDNKYSLDSNIEAIHYKENYKDERSPWLDIDTTIVDGRVSKAPYDLEVYLTGSPGFRVTSKQSGAYDIRLKEARVSDTLATVVSPNSKIIPLADGNKVTWAEYYPGVDVVLTAGSNGVYFNRIIKSGITAKQYDVTITEIERGILKVLPIQPAIDAIGQQVLMEERPTIDGRTETLKLQVVSPDVKAIAYPLVDAIDVQIGAAANDGVRYSGTTGFVVNGTTYIGYLNNASFYHSHNFDRFTGISIGAGSTITAANISAYSRSGSGSTHTYSVVYGCDADNPDAPTSNTTFDALSLTTAHAHWDDATFTASAWNNSPDISSVIQELLNSYTLSNDAVMILIRSEQTASSSVTSIGYYEWSTSYGKKLHIEFSAGGGTPSLTNTPDSKAMGTVYPDGRAIYAKGNAPGNPVERKSVV